MIFEVVRLASGLAGREKLNESRLIPIADRSSGRQQRQHQRQPLTKTEERPRAEQARDRQTASGSCDKHRVVVVIEKSTIVVDVAIFVVVVRLNNATSMANNPNK